MNNTKYTFLLPAYKARFFEEALLSIKNQTYINFKVIVSDDCSPEDLKSIYDKVCGDDPRFTFRRNEENMGSKSLVSHWNLLVDMCDTEWLIMAGDDDIYEPAFLEEMDKLQLKYPNVDLLHARARVIDAEGDVIKLDCAYDEYVSQIEFLAFLGKKDHVECVGNYVYRNNVLKREGGFVDMPLAWTSDTATNNIMSQNGCATTQQFLFNFRMSGQNISGLGRNIKEISKKKLKAVFIFDSYIKELFESLSAKTKLEEHQYQMALESQMMVVYTSFFYYSSSMNIKEMVRDIKYMKERGYIKGKYDIYRIWTKWIYSKLN
jgi:glycosyltransferase involved in cell wall biosynthesis